jgi:hypothetical protein
VAVDSKPAATAVTMARLGVGVWSPGAVTTAKLVGYAVAICSNCQHHAALGTPTAQHKLLLAGMRQATIQVNNQVDSVTSIIMVHT